MNIQHQPNWITNLLQPNGIVDDWVYLDKGEKPMVVAYLGIVHVPLPDGWGHHDNHYHMVVLDGKHNVMEGQTKVELMIHPQSHEIMNKVFTYYFPFNCLRFAGQIANGNSCVHLKQHSTIAYSVSAKYYGHELYSI